MLGRHHCKVHLLCSGTSPEALRLLLLCEVVSGTGFARDRLYIEYRLEFDPNIWKLQNETSKKKEENNGSIQVNGQIQFPSMLQTC